MKDQAFEFLQIASTDILAAAARGEIDLNRLACEQLAARGLDQNGKWVGFEQAAKIHKIGSKWQMGRF